MTNPLRFTDLFNKGHIEPSVTGLIQVQTEEPVTPPNPVNDCFFVSAFRSGKPKVLTYFETLAAATDRHDPDRNGDVGVALMRVARSGFGDRDVYGAAKLGTVRVDPALNSSANLQASGAVDLIKVETNDYGPQTKQATLVAEDASQVTSGKKITLKDVKRSFVGDNLGIALTIQYTGSSPSAALSIINAVGVITYTGNPADGDIITINGQAYEFDNNDTLASQDNVAVDIGGTDDATFANLVTAILANMGDADGAVQSTTAGTVTITAAEAGVVLVETLDSGSAFAVSNTPPSSRLQVTLSGAQTDGSADLDIPLTQTTFKTLDSLVNYINAQIGYEAAISPYANKFLASTGLDAVSGQSILTVQTLTAYTASIIDWINNNTRGGYTATEIAQGEPDTTSVQTVPFTGGASGVPLLADWLEAFDVLGAEVERGGVVIINTDDPVIHAAFVTWAEEQRTTGKWFRGYTGLAPGLTEAQILTQLGALDHTRLRATAQRLGVVQSDNSIAYMHPIYFAAAVGGGASGNLPYVKPLTNKRLRFAGLHENDSWSLTKRESLIAGGLIVAKEEEDRITVALHVTTSRDPDRRMVRIASEIDTVDLIDNAMREAFLSFRGRWAGPDIGARVYLVGGRVLDRFVQEGALVPGQSADGVAIPAYRWNPIYGGQPFVLQAGVLKLAYQIFIGGELDHISLHGSAEYQRLVAEVGSGSLVDLTTSIPVR